MSRSQRSATLRRGDLSGLWGSLAGTGVQTQLSVLAVRAGYSTNLDGGSMVGGGLSLGPFHIGVAKLSERQESGAPRAGWAMSAGAGLHRGPARR